MEHRCAWRGRVGRGLQRAGAAAVATTLALGAVAVMVPAALAEPQRMVQRTPFVPGPVTVPRFAVPAEPTSRDRVPVRQNAAGVTETVMVEVWRPQRDTTQGVEPPAQVPVILMATPYAGQGISSQESQRATVTFYVSRGYAVAIGHVYGTGASDGCWQHGGPLEVQATARMIEHLGTAPWSNGRVGMRGSSYTGMTAIAAAAHPDVQRSPYLAAIAVQSGYTSLYDGQAHGDGVGSHINTAALSPTYVGVSLLPKVAQHGSVPPAEGVYAPAPAAALQRPGCLPEHLAENQAAAVGDGGYTPYWHARDYRPRAKAVRAATLMFLGLSDQTVAPLAGVGFWERIPETTPHKLVLPQSGHGAFRADRDKMIHAWFDHFLLDHPTGVTAWPAVQVQDTEREWRVESSWPRTDGAPAQLALDADGSLGALQPDGATQYRETGPAPVVFRTPPVAAPLRVSGLPVLDLHLRVLGADDAHVMAELKVVDHLGVPVDGHPRVYGARSVRHLEPMPHDRFEQDAGLPVEPGRVYRVPLRLQPTDLVVQPGQRLQLTIGGLATSHEPAGLPSGSAGTVEILHSCDRPSVLRFSLPDERAELLDVERPSNPLVEAGLAEQAPLPPVESPRVVDGGGLVTASVCGRKAVQPLAVTRRPMTG